MEKTREGWSMGKEGRIVSGDIKNETFKVLRDESWEPHPLVKEVLLNFIITQKDNGAGVTCLFVRIPKGREIPEHFHELSNDIIVPLEGKATIWIQGMGEFVMRRGVVINIPKGVKHKIFDVTEDIFAFDVFNPGIA